MTKQSKITDVTREKICDSFWDLYKAKPIRQITVGEVAEAVGISDIKYFSKLFKRCIGVSPSAIKKDSF